MRALEAVNVGCFDLGFWSYHFCGGEIEFVFTGSRGASEGLYLAVASTGCLNCRGLGGLRRDELTRLILFTGRDKLTLYRGDIKFVITKGFYDLFI